MCQRCDSGCRRAVQGDNASRGVLGVCSTSAQSCASEPPCAGPFDNPDLALAHAQGDVGPLSDALDLHVSSWRRFLELPVDHMLAVTPHTARGRFRVRSLLDKKLTFVFYYQAC